MANKPHLKFEGRTTAKQFKTTKIGRDNHNYKLINREVHAKFLLQKVGEIKHFFESTTVNPLLINEKSLYIEFFSDWGYKLSFDSFDKSGFELLNIKEETRPAVDYTLDYRYSLVVLAKEGDISNFINKVEVYLSKNFIKTDRKTKEKIDTGEPKNKKLLNNISNLKIATLKSFWVDEPEIPFPEGNESIWWEVWFRKSEKSTEKLKNVYSNIEKIGCQIGQSQIELAEYTVNLIKGTSQQLSDSLLLLDNLAELRSPQELSNFITHRDITLETKNQYLQDLKDRVDNKLSENCVLICLLDTGINNKHPLLEDFVPDNNLYTNNSSWGVSDSYPFGGHGTGVAGLTLYGDLTDALSSNNRIQIYHGLESFKIFNNIQEDEKFDGPKYETAVYTSTISNPQNLKIYCLTILRDNIFNGRPSSGSSTIDKICFGKDTGQELFIISGGNVILNNSNEYLIKNETQCVHDPAQAYNAISIGTFTKKDKLDSSIGLIPLAKFGGMSPSNSTSLLFDKSWPNKPDIVFEGGNLASDGTSTYEHLDLRLITTDADFENHIFNSFGDSSAAAGLASKMAAELRTLYPKYNVETIRGLMIHSADWTPEMKAYGANNKRTLIRTFGYGVPNIKKAEYSMQNSLTLIAERVIQPYKYVDSRGQYNEYHLFILPWPKEELESLEENLVKLTVTISYYIDPNPGSRKFASHYSYHSHQLDFEIIKRNETEEEFQIRISKPEDEDKNNTPVRGGEKWDIGNKIGSKGSIRKDSITLTGREMSERNKLAIFPKNGWYKNLKRQNKFNEKVRYSLIVTLETEELGTDLYTPVYNLINVELGV